MEQKKKLKFGLMLITICLICGLSSIATFAVDSIYNMNADFEAYLTAQGFPESYKVELRKLHKMYPNWVFKAQHINLSWDEALEGESELSLNLVKDTASVPSAWKSMEDGAFDWDNNTWIVLCAPNWVQASKEAIAYFMNPVSSLDEIHIFQFEQLTYSDVNTEELIESVLKETFMSHAIVEGTDKTYAQTFLEIGKELNVSPVLLAARIRQEQGVAGTSLLISGTVDGYEGYYNYYNFGAYGNTTALVVQRGLQLAKENNWNSRYASLYGGAKRLANAYILKGQDTLYLQKFNVASDYYKLYDHQYMQNLTAAYSEASTTRRSYLDMGVLANTHVFQIPVYDDMTSTDYPSNDGNSNNRLQSLVVSGYSLTPDFSANVTDYRIEVPYSQEQITINATPIASTSTISSVDTVNLSVGENVVPVVVKAENGDELTYIVHVTRQEGIEETLDDSKIKLTDVKITDVTSKGYTVNCKITGAKEIDRVLFPTWTENGGQDDVIWGYGTVSGNKATYKVSISDHNDEAGNYITHIYAYDSNGNCADIEGTITDIEKEIDEGSEKTAISNIKVSNVTSTSYTITADIKNPSKINNVYFPTWTSANGQDDIIWYVGEIENDTVTVNIKTSNHNNEFGEYETHIYMQNNSKEFEFVEAENVDVPKSDKKPTMTDVQVSDVTSTGYTITGKVTDAADIDNVYFPTWTSANGQDDIQWYVGKISGNTVTVRIQTKNHNAEKGEYYTDIYLYEVLGEVQFIASQTVTIKTQAELDAEEASREAAESKSQTLANEDTAASEEKLETETEPVTEIETGTESTTVLETEEMTKKVNAKVVETTDTQIPEILDVKVSNVTKDGYNVAATVSNVQDVSKALFPTWTEKNGQDDLTWSEGVIQGNTITYSVKTSDHNSEAGSYVTHVYLYDINNNLVSIGNAYTVITKGN